MEQTWSIVCKPERYLGLMECLEHNKVRGSVVTKKVIPLPSASLRANIEQIGHCTYEPPPILQCCDKGGGGGRG